MICKAIQPMNRKERKIVYLSIFLSLLLHFVFLIIFKYEYLLGSTPEEPQNPEPLELVFEQPKPEPKPAQKMPQKFYELVENPNATGAKPKASDMLSIESSLSQAPVLQPGQIRAVPGTDLPEKDRQQTQPEKQAETEPRMSEAVKNALLAYRPSRSFSKSALTGKSETETPEKQEKKQHRGETKNRPSGFDADLVGDFALSTYSWSWAPYWLEFKRRLNRVWYAPPAYSELGLIYGYTILRFRVSRQGELQDLKVLQHVGHKSLRESSVSAVESTFPLKPLPQDFPDPYLEVTIKMIYPNLREYFNRKQ